MMFKNLSFRIKILISMLSLVFLGFFLLLASKFYEKKKDEINLVTSKLHLIKLDVYSILQDKSDFLLYETINPDFFKSGDSEYIKNIKIVLESIGSKLKSLTEPNSFLQDIKEGLVNDLVLELDKFQYELDLLAQYTLIRGFKNYGIEGEMREFAHQIEVEFEDVVERSDILMLRRHEKDFILRKEMKYLSKFNYQSDSVQNKIFNNDEISNFTKSKIYFSLNQYKNYFDSLVSLENTIRIKEGSILGNLEEIGNSINLELDELELICADKQNQLLQSLENKFLVGLFIFTIMIIVLSFRLSSKLTIGIKKLSNNVKSFVESNYKETANYEGFKGRDEIAELAKNLKILEDEIVIHFEFYKSKVEKRTQEILKQKTDIESKQKVIEKKNHDILSSIRYARKIQESILPKPRFLNELLPEHFIIYQPKDIVSGDFYWIERFQGKVFVAVSDCTGHGVPGAFMSIMGNNFLNQAINEKKLIEPDQILNYLNISIATSLQQYSNMSLGSGNALKAVQDGMDIALISIDYFNNEIIFSGAQRPLLLVRDKEIIEIKGDRFPVGGFSNGKMRKFTPKTIKIQQNDCVYLFSRANGSKFSSFRI